MEAKYPKGAEWKKWDLHIHTPGTAKNDQYKSEYDNWDEYIEKIEQNSEIALLGITDYYSIDNYLRIKEYQNLGRLQGKVILPNVELRITPVTRESTPINIHIIFDPALDENIIKREFFGKFVFKYQQGEYSCRKEDLISLGRAYKSNPDLEETSAWKAGIEQYNISQLALQAIIKGSLIKNRCLIGVSNNSKDGNSGIQHSSLAATRQEIYRFSDFIFSSNPNDVNYFLGKGVDKREKVIADYGSIKPCFTGCDAHSFSDMFNFDSDRYTWVKADPTFEGLKQIINEPEDRVYIGIKPSHLEKLSKNRTKYISNLSLTKLANYDGRYGSWFNNVSIPLNSELVAIIGNKGSGKSAIADVLAICSNYSPNDKDFSFLTTGKFKRNKLAENFEATLLWDSGKSTTMNLGGVPADSELLDVKYLPQGRFERLTNEIRTAEQFQKEIESVVFSHIPESERLGTLSLNELIEKKTESVTNALKSLGDDIRNLNNVVIDLEHKATTAYKQEIFNKFEKKQEELNALIEPLPVSDPNEDPEKKRNNEEANGKIDKLKNEILELQSLISATNDEKKIVLETLQKLKNTKSRVKQKEMEFERFISELGAELGDYELNIKDMIVVKTDYHELDRLIKHNEDLLVETKIQLGEELIDEQIPSLSDQLQDKKNQLDNEKSKLDTEQQRFQQYLSDREVWENDKALIIGTSEKFESLKYYEQELKYLDEDLNSELEKKYSERYDIVVEIFKKKQEVIAVYKDVRTRLKKVIEDNQETLKNYRIKVDAALVCKSDFKSKFLSYILQNKMGSFHSKEGGEAQLSNILADIDFDKSDSIIGLLNSIIEALKHDKRLGQNDENRAVENQVKDISGFYDYLFTLEFLENNYQLKQGDKELEQLSPGERGALLLVFYLLLDKNDIPLIIDQPEDNLDNHSIASILVPFIRAAKKKRQIIMVTHNPNLAVVSDAEQIIYVSLNKEDNYSFSFISGSIENKEINKRIVDVLEGAMPAFNTRKRKYYD